MRLVIVLACLAWTSAEGAAHAAPLSIDWAEIGDVGNAADTDPVGYGAVSYPYKIMKYEFTNQQYVNFLNAVDPEGTNPNGIYFSIASIDGRGGYTFLSGNANGSKYAVRANMGDKPVNWVSWFSVARVANWLQAGGQTYLTTATGSAAINSGAYTLNGQTTGNAPLKNAGAQYWIPTQDEWYKAAYYKGGGTNAGYWNYATQSDTAPATITASLTGVGSAGNTGNFANYNSGAVWNAQTGNVTSVGTNGGPSAYGTFDMTGNILEYFDGVTSSSSIARRGGFYGSDSTQIASSFSYGGVSTSTPNVGTGFRIAAVPEPSTIALLAVGGLVAGLAARRRAPRG